MQRRFIATLLALCMVLTLLPGTAWAEGETSTSGTCGYNITWDFDTSTGTLTISGQGEMTDYACSWGSDAPWGSFMDNITSVIISEGITYIGNGAFGGDMKVNMCQNLTSISLPSTLKSIGRLSFAGSAITSVSLPDGLVSIGPGAFSYTNLTSISIPESVTYMGNDGWFAFNCRSLTRISIAAGNRYFEVEDNILYNKGKTELVFYPYKYFETSYAIPSTVKTLDLGTFFGHEYLTELVIPAGTKLTMEMYSGPDGLDFDLSKRFSIYFYGSAPNNLEDFGFFNNNGAWCGLDIYYVEGTSGWDTYTSKDYYDAEAGGYWLTFHTWMPQNPDIGEVDPTYSVSYELNGGNGTVPFAQNYIVGSTVPITSTVPTRAGYTFVGWSDGTITYQAGQAFAMPSRAVILTAQWKQEVPSQPSANTIAQQFVNTALAQRGKSGSYFGFTKAWCGLFVGWCAAQNNLQNIISSTGANGVQHYNYVINHGGSGVRFYNNRKDMKQGTYLTDRNNYTPQVGDIVIFTWDGGTSISHVGIVCGVNNGKINVVHGNWAIKTPAIVVGPGDKCTTSWNITDSKIYAYARPNWMAANTSVLGTRVDRYQCPISVRYEYGGEILDSATGQLSSSFGTMTLGNDDSITVELNSYCDANITITGIGAGVMDLTSTYYDNSGIVGAKVFQQVPITQNTFIELYAYDDIDTEYLMLYTGPEKTFIEAWGADTNDITTKPNQELTDWLLDENSSTMPSESIPETIPTVSGNSSGSNHIDPNYIIITPTHVAGGTVTTSSKSAAKGSIVTVTITPDTGYELASLTVSDKNGKAISLSDNSGGKYTFVMPDGKVSVDAAFRPIQTPNEPQARPETPAYWNNPFYDVTDDMWYYDSVKFVNKNGLMNGVSETQFEPDTATSRAMIWTVLARMNNVNVSSTSDLWYEEGMLWAMEHGVTDGTNPMDNITREQLATMLWRNAEWPVVWSDLSQFSDSDSVSDYALTAIHWAVASGILHGSGEELNPIGTATRAEVAAMVMRYAERIGA